MVFLLGKTLASPQHVLYALAAQFEGVGRATARRMCNLASIHKYCRVRDLNERQLSRLRDVLVPHIEDMKRLHIERTKAERGRPKPIAVPQAAGHSK